MNRQQPNWIAIAFGIAYVLCFLFLPFYNIMLVPASGLFLLQYINPVLAILLVAGILLAISGWVIQPKISMLIGAVTFVLTLALSLFGNAVVTGGNGLTGVASSLLRQLGGVDISSQLWVSVGVGGILCVICSALHPCMELLLNRPSAPVKEEETDFFH